MLSGNGENLDQSNAVTWRMKFIVEASPTPGDDVRPWNIVRNTHPFGFSQKLNEYLLKWERWCFLSTHSCTCIYSQSHYTCCEWVIVTIHAVDCRLQNVFHSHIVCSAAVLYDSRCTRKQKYTLYERSSGNITAVVHDVLKRWNELRAESDVIYILSWMWWRRIGNGDVTEGKRIKGCCAHEHHLLLLCSFGELLLSSWPNENKHENRLGWQLAQMFSFCEAFNRNSA